jgi:hypothetical protein
MLPLQRINYHPCLKGDFNDKLKILVKQAKKRNKEKLKIE